jgi:hypothetical protein
LPNYPVPKNRKYDKNYGIICTGDEMMIRVQEMKIKFYPEKKRD